MTAPLVSDDLAGVDNFREYQQELDARNDRYERIVKLSRDILQESKRIIFELHRFTKCITDDNKKTLLKSAYDRLIQLRNKKFSEIAKELVGLDQNMYIRAYGFALEEYIEAWSFYKFIRSGKIFSWYEIRNGLFFGESENKMHKIFVEVPAVQFLLGQSDVGGELMRLAINVISEGGIDVANNVANYLRALYREHLIFEKIIITSDWQKKMETTLQSLQKVEEALCDSKIRRVEELQAQKNAAVTF